MNFLDLPDDNVKQILDYFGKPQEFHQFALVCAQLYNTTIEKLNSHVNSYKKYIFNDEIRKQINKYYQHQTNLNKHTLNHYEITIVATNIQRLHQNYLKMTALKEIQLGKSNIIQVLTKYFCQVSTVYTKKNLYEKYDKLRIDNQVSKFPETLDQCSLIIDLFQLFPNKQNRLLYQVNTTKCGAIMLVSNDSEECMRRIFAKCRYDPFYLSTEIFNITSYLLKCPNDVENQWLNRFYISAAQDGNINFIKYILKYFPTKFW